MSARLVRAARRVVEEWQANNSVSHDTLRELAAVMPRKRGTRTKSKAQRQAETGAADLAAFQRLPLAKPEPTDRDAKRREKWAQTGTVKAQAFKRDGCCVLCDGPIHDPHHLLYGSGNRTQQERLETVASLCRTHHDLAHDGDVQTLTRLVEWAKRLRYWEAARATERRIAKIRRVEIRVRRIAG